MTQQQFEHIYISLRQKLLGLARKFSKASSVDMDEEDIVQEALQAFWELSEKGYPIRNPEALLVKITKNICVSHYRRYKYKSEQIGQMDFISDELPTKSTDDTDIELIKSLLYEKLTATERDYMHLKTDGDLTLDEIAKETGKTKPGIKTALSKAKSKMQNELKKLGII